MSHNPGMGEIVHYVSRTGAYELPAMVAATKATLHPGNVEAGYIAELSESSNVHLVVFSPGPSGRRASATDFVVESPHGRQENSGGTYTEVDIAQDPSGSAGTWHHPLMCPFGAYGGLPS